MSLVETRNDGVITVRCKHCSTVLAEIQEEIQEDTRKAWVITECEHFRWEQVRTPCFYQYWYYPQECDAGYIERLRRRYFLRIDDGERFFLLVPREAEEE